MPALAYSQYPSPAHTDLYTQNTMAPSATKVEEAVGEPLLLDDQAQHRDIPCRIALTNPGGFRA